MPSSNKCFLAVRGDFLLVAAALALPLALAGLSPAAGRPPSSGALPAPQGARAETRESTQHEAKAEQDVGPGQCEPAVVSHSWDVSRRR